MLSCPLFVFCLIISVRVVGGEEKGRTLPAGITERSVTGRDLGLQVEGVSNLR
jgi:hypothetical protein